MSFFCTFTSACPACNNASMYDGVLSVCDICPSCGLVLKEHDAADGPAYIAICIVGTLVMLAVVFVEMAYMPPMWLHMVLWLPLTIFGSLVVLRLAKNWLIHAQYKHQQNLK